MIPALLTQHQQAQQGALLGSFDLSNFPRGRQMHYLDYLDPRVSKREHLLLKSILIKHIGRIPTQEEVFRVERKASEVRPDSYSLFYQDQCLGYVSVNYAYAGNLTAEIIFSTSPQ